MRKLLLSTVFCLFCSVAAQADTFVFLPNGELAFNTSFTTQGTFTCALCSGSGTNSVVFGSGGNTLTITFNGVNTTMLVGGQSVPTLAGQIQIVASGAGFVFPTSVNPNVPLLVLNLGITQSSPAAGTGSVLFNTNGGGGTSLPVHTTFMDYAALPTGPIPPGFGFTHIVFSFTSFTIPNTSGLVDVNANVVAVPEATTLLLLGSGVGMMLPWLRKRFSKP
jgi:hypothetical protein